MGDIAIGLIGAITTMVGILQNVPAEPAVVYATERPAPSVETFDVTPVLQGNLSSLATTSGPLSDPVPVVPFFSQFADISDPSWKKRSCGIASLAMLINYYKPSSVTPDMLLREGVAIGGYIESAGWAHRAIIDLAARYGLEGKAHDLSGRNIDAAFAAFREALGHGPAIASVHYTFDAGNPIPHLVVITGIDRETLYYNDPAETEGGGSIPVATFKSSWKKRFIEIQPPE